MDNTMRVKYDLASGGLKSLVNAKDPYEMNWVEGAQVWGTIKDGELVSCRETTDGIGAVYHTKHLEISVRRALIGNRYRERYVFRGRIATDVFFNRGAVGVYATFNDNYEIADVSMHQRCAAHIWCGRNTSYVDAVKMGPCDFGLAMVLTEGSLDSYSVERPFEHSSDDRGDFIMHPSPFNLAPGEEMTLEWELFFYETGQLRGALAAYPSVILADADCYTVFEGEPIRFTVNRSDAQVSLDGRQIPVEQRDGSTCVNWQPERRGEHRFVIRSGDVETIAEFFVQIPLEELVRRRVAFIVDHQQFHKPGSALDGAYMIYDKQDGCLIFDELFPDFNASRERLVMGIMIAKYLQYRPDERVYASLMEYYRYVSREFFDETTGMVYNTIGKNPEFKRLYNGPWMGMFLMELYKLTGQERYLDLMLRTMHPYYEAGGDNFYPNGMTMYETVAVLRRAGRNADADKLEQMFRKHVDRICRNGLNYPTHEVRYEQTIVTPAVNLTAQMWMLTHDDRLADGCRLHMSVLECFNGHQPSYHLNDVSLRHWDGYWFGKRRMYGDTMPHSASVHTSVAFWHYAQVTGDETYLRRAEASARNTLCLFHEDGSASVCWLYPFSVNGIRCEYFDEFCNEQDGVLYYMMKTLGMMNRQQ